MLPWEQAAVQQRMPWEYPAASDKEAQRAKLRDFDYYREKFLRIRPREGGERIPFILNNAQRVLHARLEEEKQTFGMVRALIPKARRMGVSTLIGGRFFHQTATQFGRRSQVVAHRTDSAANLHREIKEFCNGLPLSLQPSVGATNARELIFDKLKSLYKVASAEGGDIGRSDDFHALHLSEAAFMENVEDLSSGLLQTVQDLPGTEEVLESTGNGKSGMFYNMCQQAHSENNKGLWRLHFLAWCIMPEYRVAVPFAWQAPKEFEDYGRMHGLDREQLYWFWTKNYTLATMNGGQPETIHRLTRQEYPATYSECFMADSTLDFYPASLVEAAMLRQARPAYDGLKILAIDPAGDGQDQPWVCDRQGPAIGSRVWGALTTRDYNVQADWLIQTFDRFNMDVIAVDRTGGYGKGLVDALRLRMLRRGPEKIVPIDFSWGAVNQLAYGNRRAEIHDKLGELIAKGASMPNDKLAQEEGAAYKWGLADCRRDEKGRLFMTAKEKIKKALGRSPDRWDSMAVSCAIDG